MEKLPDYLIESYIIPYLSSDDLFYKMRSLNSYYYKCARNKILTHFPGEMMLLLKKIIDFNSKEDLTKNFEEVMKKTFSEKKLLIILMLQMNPSLLIKNILESNQDQRTLELISLFFIVTNYQNMYNLLEQNNINEIITLSSGDEGKLNMRTKISEFLEDDNLNFDLNEYNTVYESLDREFLLENNNTNALYTYLRLLINFCDTKIKLNEVKTKLEYFFKQISDASEIWPKKRIFYEKTIDLVADTQILSDGAKIMLNLMKKYEIENDLNDYVYNKEIIKDFKKKETFDIIKYNRKKLNFANLRMQQMYSFFMKSIFRECEDIKDIKFKIGYMIFGQGDFLYILSMINKNFPINEYTFMLTYNHLRHHILFKIYNIYTEKQEKEVNNFLEGKIQSFKDDKNNNNYVMENNNMGYSEDELTKNLKEVYENTKLAEKQINDTFKTFSNDLNNLNQDLS